MLRDTCLYYVGVDDLLTKSLLSKPTWFHFHDMPLPRVACKHIQSHWSRDCCVLQGVEPVYLDPY